MLLSYIEDLMDKRISHSNTYNIYKILVDQWIEREVSRQRNDRSEFFRYELISFSQKIARYMFYNFQTKSELFIKGSDIE